MFCLTSLTSEILNPNDPHLISFLFSTEEVEEEEEDEEEEISEDDKTKRKRSAARGAATGRNAREDKVSKTGRPRRSTAGRGKADVSSYVEYSSSEEDEKFTKKQPAKRKRADDSDSGSDVSVSRKKTSF